MLFVAAFLFAQGLGFLITYSVINEKVSFIKCDNGKEFENPYPGFDFYEFTNENDLSKRCTTAKNNLQQGSGKFDPLAYGAVPVNLTYAQIEKPKYSVIEKFGLYVASFAFVSLIFWLISRIFFYVLTGERFLEIRTR